ncbi:carbamoyltransferase C-terminal domain-containing protein [Sphaerisporangium sp. NPDC051017]|uniref:carbamoyltransferase C-terminal domain-containing protein n=1 Tax=Sphaerisporangium sp. NPDC051017 TaxID=3154636 RepID=UPI003433197B
METEPPDRVHLFVVGDDAEPQWAGRSLPWFSGGSELGPRALGHRSILADPRTTATRDALKHHIKHREPFRPFAPAVLHADGSRWFGLDAAGSPFMLPAPAVRPDRAALIPAVVHVDGTARAQTVDPTVNPRFLLIAGCSAPSSRGGFMGFSQAWRDLITG